MAKRPREAEQCAVAGAEQDEKQAALADRADTSIGNLKTSLVDFLNYIMQDLCCVHDPATEQVEAASSKAPWKDYTMLLRQCNEIIVDELKDVWTAGGYYNEPALLLHKKMWDVMLRCPPHK